MLNGVDANASGASGASDVSRSCSTGNKNRPTKTASGRHQQQHRRTSSSEDIGIAFKLLSDRFASLDASLAEARYKLSTEQANNKVAESQMASLRAENDRFRRRAVSMRERELRLQRSMESAVVEANEILSRIYSVKRILSDIERRATTIFDSCYELAASSYGSTTSTTTATTKQEPTATQVGKRRSAKAKK